MSSIACGALLFKDSGAAIAKEEQKCKTAKINVRDCLSSKKRKLTATSVLIVEILYGYGSVMCVTSYIV